MHTAHIILVKAEDHDDAIATVRSALTPDEGGHFASAWSDWAMVGDEGYGGSRFEFQHFLEDGEEWSGASRYAVSRDDEADLFYKMLDKFYGFRQSAFDRRQDELRDQDFSVSLDQDDQVTYSLYKLAELADSRYCYESAVYDLVNYTANLRYFRQDEADNGHGWYAVLVDFHF